MWAGLLREKIEIWSFTKVRNEYGEYVTESSKVRDSRAKVVHLSGSRSVMNNEVVYPYRKEFCIRMGVPVDEDNWIKWEGKFYRILSIDRDQERQQQVIVTEIVNE